MQQIVKFLSGLQAEYDSSPLIVNFKMIKEEVEYLLKEFEDKLII